MARYTDAVCKLCRREGEKLFLKGERCLTNKCAFERRPYPPGMHGPQAQWRRKTSDYALQLREKQKVRRVYGVMERQFRRYFREAERSSGLTGPNLIILLERRLDNVVYRLSFADSRAQARQLVRHGHFEVNGRKTDIPSFRCKPGDVIIVCANSQSKQYFKDRAHILGDRPVPNWLTLDAEQMSGKVLNIPQREEVEISLQDQLIVEYYSR
ncbi:MAG: 30S ribosomal protein S4 [Chloroflexi bacterium]|nr:30S ribosomal protein S4 [Chloroflexota bacterium]